MNEKQCQCVGTMKQENCPSHGDEVKAAIASRQHHYFATHAMGWATAPTREEAHQKLMQDTDPTWVRNCLKDGSLLTVYSCRVPLPADAPYKINWFLPVVDGISDGQNHFVTYLTKTKHALMRDPSDTLKLEIKKLEAELEQYSALEAS